MAFYRTYSWASADTSTVATACTLGTNAFVDAIVANEGFTLINYSVAGSIAFIEKNGIRLGISPISTSTIVEGTYYSLTCMVYKDINGTWTAINGATAYAVGHNSYYGSTYHYTFDNIIKIFNCLGDGCFLLQTMKNSAIYASIFGMIQVQEIATGNLYYAMVINGGHYWDTSGSYLMMRNDSDSSIRHYIISPLWTEPTGVYELLNPLLVCTLGTYGGSGSALGSEPNGLRYICKGLYASRNSSGYGGIVRINNLFYFFNGRIAWQISDR